MKVTRPLRKPKGRKIPQYLIVFDPGGTCGWAVFRNGRLVACGYGAKAKYLDKMVVSSCRGALFVVERPRIYPGRKSKVPPNDLLETDHLAGQLEALYRLHGAETKSVYPKDWKGNIPKPKAGSGDTYLIEERVLEQLDAEERAVLYGSKSARATGLDDNMIDAVGIGLKELRRRNNQ